MKKIRAILCSSLLVFCATANAQTPPDPGEAGGYPTQYLICDGSPASDSACLPHTNSACLTVPVSEKLYCSEASGGAGYSGIISKTGERNACTAVTTWTGEVDTTNTGDPNSIFYKNCTDCGGATPTPLTPGEYTTIQNVIVGLSETFNIQLVRRLSLLNGVVADGEMIRNTISYSGVDGSWTADFDIGRVFRDRVWVDSPFDDSPVAIPTYQRVKALVSEDLMSNKMPGAPDDFDGGLTVLFEAALVRSQSYTGCTSSQNGCNVTGCNPSTAGLFDSNCRDINIVRDENICGTAFYRFEDWRTGSPTFTPTANIEVPWTAPTTFESATSLKIVTKNFADKVWDWPTVLGWNAEPATGGGVFACSSTVYTCLGWVAQGANTVCEGTWTNVYNNDPITGQPVLVGVACQPGAGQRGLFTRSYFYNNCTNEQTIVENPPPVGQSAADATKKLNCCKNTSYPAAGYPGSCV